MLKPPVVLAIHEDIMGSHRAPRNRRAGLVSEVPDFMSECWLDEDRPDTESKFVSSWSFSSNHVETPDLRYEVNCTLSDVVLQ